MFRAQRSFPVSQFPRLAKNSPANNGSEASEFFSLSCESKLRTEQAFRKENAMNKKA
ncbi:hypothetical protein LPTSP4_33670 [Leptospira ryugenii]|uniref:Uncharacterized protein n=1 Tax=Leptospira ryugenii TaxID=1917863 RepID=A0A2P2E4N2_9LEPT|nr:hypothetical protein LPTSP4_33670 [Leptospira ryugenii]